MTAWKIKTKYTPEELANRNDYSRWTDLKEEEVKEWFETINNTPLDRMQALEIVKSFKPTSLIEIGTGGGQDYSMFKKHLPDCNYTGVDVSAGIISELKTRYPEINMVEANFYDGLSFKDGSFDIVYARHILEHCPEYKKPIKEMLRLAKNAIVVTMYKTFVNQRSVAQEYYGGRNENRYDRVLFIKFLNSLGLDYELVPQLSRSKRDIVVIKR